jgi:hypothetical protein
VLLESYRKYKLDKEKLKERYLELLRKNEQTVRKLSWKIVKDVPRHPEKLHNIIIEVKRTAGFSRNSYIDQIKNNAKAKTFKELK